SSTRRRRTRAGGARWPGQRRPSALAGRGWRPWTSRLLGRPAAWTGGCRGFARPPLGPLYHSVRRAETNAVVCAPSGGPNVREMRDVQVPMRDGTILYGDVYLPDGEEIGRAHV